MLSMYIGADLQTTHGICPVLTPAVETLEQAWNLQEMLNSTFPLQLQHNQKLGLSFINQPSLSITSVVFDQRFSVSKYGSLKKSLFVQ